MKNPAKGQVSLRKGRRSAKGGRYFLTMCLEEGKTGLDTPKVFNASLQLGREIEASAAIQFYAIVIMPDHLHLLIRLLDKTKLEDFAKSFKGRLSPVLRNLGIRWQRGYFGRLIRDQDSVDVVVRYMLMNPYRKGLIDSSDKWPYWYCSDQAKVWMDDLEGIDKPVPKWLQL